jgi:hypothetical protein
MVEIVQIIVFNVKAPCILVDGYKHFKGISYLHLQGQRTLSLQVPEDIFLFTELVPLLLKT